MARNKEYRKALQSFSYLWKVDDDSWLKDQKEMWRVLRDNLYKGSDVDDVRGYQDYFIYGRNNSYIPPHTLYFLTPFQIREQADNFFVSGMLSDRDRSSIIGGGFVRGLGDINQDCRIIVRKKVREIIEWRRGSGLHEIHVKNELCHRPDDFIKSYIDQLFNLYIKRKKYSPSLDLLDYFLKSFPLLQDKKIIESIKSRDRIAELIDWSVDIIKDKKATPAMKEQANQLLDNRDEIEAIWNKVSKQ